MEKPVLATIIPKEYPEPQMRKELYNAVDAVSSYHDPIVGYAFVSIHQNGAFHAYHNIPGAQVMDIPEMVKTRLQAVIFKNMR